MMEEQQVSLGLEIGGYYTAGKGYSLKVVVNGNVITFSISGDRTAQTSISTNLLIPVVGALDFIGTGIVSRKEVIGSLYVEKGTTFGRVRIRIKREDGEKVFVEVPCFEASSLASYILNTVNIPATLRYGILDYALEVAPIFGDRKIAIRGYSATDEAKYLVFDPVSYLKFLSSVKNACLGGLYVPIKISGLKGYVVVQEYLEAEKEESREEVKVIVQEISRAARTRNLPPLPLIREALRKKGIPHKHVVRLRLGEGVEGENRLEIRIPTPHAWGLAKVGEKLVGNLPKATA